MIYNSLSVGEVEVLHVDNDEYIMKRAGSDENPGLILYISTSDNIKRRTIA